jgi:hypothetical protein
MLLAACFLLFASLNRDRSEQKANSEQQEARSKKQKYPKFN